MTTRAKITIELGNDYGPSAKSEQEFDLPHPIADEQLSPLADQAKRAASMILGVKIPKVKKLRSL